jgi:hypothetical protein
VQRTQSCGDFCSFDDCFCHAETDMALLIEVPTIGFESEKMWIPKSQIHTDSENSEPR